MSFYDLLCPSPIFLYFSWQFFQCLQVRKASTMLECLCWDPTARYKCPLSIASIPFEHNFEGVGSTYRGNMYVLEAIGRVMACNGDSVVAIIFDAHGSHVFCRKILHGQLSSSQVEGLNSVPFFSELQFVPLPSCCLPRLPMQIAYHRKEVIYGIPGICGSEHLNGSK